MDGPRCYQKWNRASLGGGPEYVACSGDNLVPLLNAQQIRIVVIDNNSATKGRRALPNPPLHQAKNRSNIKPETKLRNQTQKHIQETHSSSLMKYLAFVPVLAMLGAFIQTTSAAAASPACLDCFAGCTKTTAPSVEDCVMACKTEHRCSVTFVTFDLEKQRIEKIVHNGGNACQ